MAEVVSMTVLEVVVGVAIRILVRTSRVEVMREKYGYSDRQNSVAYYTQD